MKKEFKFPTIIGLIFLILAVVAGIYATQSTKIFNSKASDTCGPENIQITNITNSAVNISFTTTSACSFSLSANAQTFDDVRSTPSRLHYFEVKHLSSETNYKFSLINNGNLMNSDNYNFKTATTPATAIPTSNLAWGKVFNPDKKTPAMAIVFLNIPGAAPLSSIVTTNGNWSVSLANSFNDAKNNWFTPPSSPISEEIIAISEDGTATQITNTTDNNNPVPNIIIGTNFLEPISEEQKAAIGQFDVGSGASTQKKVDIYNPKDGDILQTNKPDFFGSAPTNSKVIIEVHSDVLINGETSSSPSGEWHWSPPSNLTPGEHTITVKSQNLSTGVWETVTRNFTVLAADSAQPQYTASNSATTPTLTPTPTETIVITPTVRVAQVSTASGAPPVTGNTLPTVLIISSALLFFVISVNFLK